MRTVRVNSLLSGCKTTSSTACALHVRFKKIQTFTRVSSVSGRRQPLKANRRTVSVCARPKNLDSLKAEASTLSAPAVAPVPITLTSNARQQLQHLKKSSTKGDQDMILRVGVRSGGCSGMSYTMDFEEQSNVSKEDIMIDHGDVQLVCDPKSLLYMFGMQLDYSDKLVGGGFQFFNPNAKGTCGCGKSFGV